MSYLNGSPEDWRAHLERIIFSERNIQGNTPRQQSQRYSLDIVEETIVQKKMAEDKSFMLQTEAQTLIKENFFSDEEKENNDQNKLPKIEKRLFVKADAVSTTGSNCCKDKFMNETAEDKLQWVSDDSFEVMERMCNKTSSDPNSTLFQYLHSDDKDNFVAKAKQSLQSNNSFDAEVDALQRLLDDLREQDIKDGDETSLKSSDITQLEDIEAPSRLWENTITADTILQTSPVKMVGLLRPSTIIEENDASTCSSQSSFKSAAQTAAQSEISSYETAHDSTASTTKSQVTDAVSVSLQQTADNLDNILDHFKDDTLKNAIFYRTPKKNQNDINPEVDDRNKDEAEGDESIIEVSSEDDEDDSHNEVNEICAKINKSQDTVSEVENTGAKNSPIDSAQDSLHFNDTIEEVEYMLKKGMEYMGTKKKSPKINTTFSPEKPKQTENLSEKASPFAKPKPIGRYDIDMSSSVHKLDIFNSGGSSKNQKRTLNKKFLHIKSPVGAYMHQTSTTPLMASAKMDNEQCHNSKVFRELEYESRLCQPKFGHNSYNIPIVRSHIPKKAYISSELKQVTDERTPIVIPGGQKIQKYLENAMLPAVVRHEGKAKLPHANTDHTSHIPRRKETSLADLSLASGDVSLYTIMDAKKF